MQDRSTRRPYTHYDILSVAADAPPEVVKAAYRALSQKFHPDLNPGNPSAARAMAIINASYEVLSDPEKRRAYDFWLSHQQVPAPGPARPPSSPRSRSVPSPMPQPVATDRGSGFAAVLAHVLRYWVLYGLAIFFAWVTITHKRREPPPGPKPYVAVPAPARPTRPPYVRPTAAPNGQPWPAIAAYVGGYRRLHTDGLSRVTIDNSQNDSDVFVKLVSLSGPEAYPVRQFFIPAFGRFTLKSVSPGSYDVRYRDLSSGGLSRSESFLLEETPTHDGTQYSTLTMTLYKVRDGNMQTFDLSEDEFE